MSPSSAVLSRVVGGQLCTGCGLCAAVSDGAIAMQPSERGYNRPVQTAPLSEAAEATVSSACPGSVVAPWPTDSASTPDPFWGPWRSVSTGFATDAALRFAASSGGVVSALAIHALKTGVVDRVIHVMADPERPTRNIVTCSRTPDLVGQGAGSRYAASSPLAIMEAVLAEGGKAAFIGKPCDVSALRGLARIDPRVDRHVPVMLSFFCAGVPSAQGAERIIKAMGLEPAEVVSFRYRGNGWPGLASATTRDGRVGEMTYEDSWGGHLSHEVQFRCKICPDAVGGAADVAMADAWFGGEAGYPTFEELPGRSLIMARTSVGERLLADAVASGAVEIEPLQIADIYEMQPSQAARKRAILARTMALAVLGQPRPQMRGLAVVAAARKASLKELLRNLLGTIRRIVINRR